MPSSRTNILRESTGGTLAYPGVMIDSSHEWMLGYDDGEARGYVTRSLAREPKANVVAVYQKVGNLVKFLVTVTNNSGGPLHAGNKAAVHAMIYEDASGFKTSRIGRDAKKADISYLANGKTDSFFIELDGSKVTDWTKVHFIALVDYRFNSAKSAGKYDQLQAAIATEGTVTQPALFKVDPQLFTFAFNDRATTLPTGETTVTLDPTKTWTAATDVPWLDIDVESGANGEKIKFTVTTKEHFTYGKNYGSVVVTESGTGRQRAATVEIDYSKAPTPVFKVLPVSITKTIKHSDPPGPEVGVRVSGDDGQTWTAESEQDWIILTPASGNVPATFIVTFDRTKLANGLNEGKITVRDGDDFHEKTVTVNITYIPEGEEPPAPEYIYFPLVVKPE